MARTFRRHRTAHPLADLNVTNLVDLAFVLLLIFMIATPLITPEQSLGLNLPVESKSPQPKNDLEKMETVSIDARGNYFLGSTPVSLAELRTRLAAMGALPEARRPVIRIKADLTLQLQAFVSLTDELKKANLTKISIATRPND